MKKKNILNNNLVVEYKGLLDSLSKEYIDKKIDINTLELKYRKLTNNIAEKYGIAIPLPLTHEYIKLDEYGEKEVEKSIGRRFPRTILESIFEECSFTEPTLKVDESLLSLLKKIGFKGKVMGEKNNRKKSKF
jgi:hypothetical protein